MIPISRTSRTALIVAALITLVGCAGQAQGPQAAAPPRPAPTPTPTSSSTPPTTADSSPSWLTVDSAARTATLTLEVTAPPGASSALINGYRAGEARIIVPLGWTVRWNWRNTDSTSPHSLVVMVQREKIPLEGGRPAFTNAMTRMLTTGLPPGATDQTTFVADEAGWYWLVCGVPSHALKGEWLELRVDPDAKTASVQVKQKREQ
jgi:sulfocyanin SoxE-like protein